MTTTMFSSAKSRAHTTILLPYLPEHCGSLERDIYMSFLRAYRDGTSRRMEVRILTAIHRAADLTDNSDAYVTRVLVDLGLMAPRLALPGDFLDHIDATLLRDRPLGSVPASYLALAQHWRDIGDDSYASVCAFAGLKDTPRGYITEPVRGC